METIRSKIIIIITCKTDDAKYKQNITREACIQSM